MSVGVKITYLQVPAIAHRKPVPGELVLSALVRHSKTSASRNSQHADGCGRCPSIAAIAREAVKIRRNVLRQPSRCTKSP